MKTDAEILKYIKNEFNIDTVDIELTKRQRMALLSKICLYRFSCLKKMHAPDLKPETIKLLENPKFYKENIIKILETKTNLNIYNKDDIVEL
jgi:hypothetical protein